jgi:double-strand break repair protein MRE11
MAGDIFRIMIATDNHLGYMEKHELRKDDSFLSFEEVLQKSIDQACDFLLLGGDLFHEHNPSKYTLNRTFDMFDRHIIGQRVHNFTTISTPVPLNYFRDDINIRMPIFIVHGNHDDPSLDTNLSAVSLVHTTKYVNYIINQNDEDSLLVEPVILQKGRTKLAIYCLGHVKEERLNRLISTNKLQYKVPPDYEQHFNILVVHQNRFKGNGLGAPAKNCIRDWSLPGFVDFVIWGHEHDSLVNPSNPEGYGYFILQPGSTVATSLTEGEALQKHMFRLEVKLKGHKLTPVPIKNSRQILHRKIVLSEHCITIPEAEQFICSNIEDLLISADKTMLQPPLLRLKVENSGFEDLATFHLASRFQDRTANKDIITLWKSKREDGKMVETSADFISDSKVISEDVFEMLNRKLEEDSIQLKLISPKEFLNSVHDYAIKNDIHSLENLFLKKNEMALEKAMKSIGDEFDEVDLNRVWDHLDISSVEVSYKRAGSSMYLEGVSKKIKHS